MEKYIGIRPPYGIMVCRDGSRHKVVNTELLRVWVLEVAERHPGRQGERDGADPRASQAGPGQCSPCGICGDIAARRGCNDT